MAHINSKQIIYAKDSPLIKQGSSGKAFTNKRFNVINLCCCGNIILISSQVTCAGAVKFMTMEAAIKITAKLFCWFMCNITLSPLSKHVPFSILNTNQNMFSKGPV